MNVCAWTYNSVVTTSLSEYFLRFPFKIYSLVFNAYEFKKNVKVAKSNIIKIFKHQTRNWHANWINLWASRRQVWIANTF